MLRSRAAGAVEGVERQGLESARASGRLAAQIGELESDEKKVAAGKGAVELAGKAWEAAENGRENRVAAQHTREIVVQVERVIQDEIHGIEGRWSSIVQSSASKPLRPALPSGRGAGSGNPES